MKQLFETLGKWLTVALSILCAVVFLLAIASIGSTFIVGRDVPASVTTARVERVRRGMSASQLLAVLGRPYYIYSYKGSGTHNLADCDAAASKEGVFDIEVRDSLNIGALLRHAAADSTVHKCDIGDFRAHDRNTVFTYSRPAAGAGCYPMLWVHLDSTAHVSGVSVKQYTPYFFLEDDAEVYLDSEPLATNPGRRENMLRLFGR